MRTPEASTPALSLQGVPALLRAVHTHSELASKAQLNHTRQQLCAVFNAAIRQDQHTPPAQVVERTMNELCLGITQLQRQKGMEAVAAQLEANTLDTLVALGRQLKQMYLQEPLNALRERNRLHADTVLSSTVRDALQCCPERRTQLVSQLFIDIATSGDCDTIVDLITVRTETKELERALDIADALDVRDARTEEGVESGLAHLMKETDERISYLEIAVFNAVFAKRHRLKQKDRFTFPAKAAHVYKQDVLEDYNMPFDVKRKYQQICATLFPAQAHAAQVLLERYLESVTEYAIKEQQRAEPRGTTLSPELFFPVDRYSESVLRSPKT